MKKSKIETAETRRHIIVAASALFLEKGLAETGIADVMRAAGLTPGGFYRHFDSKDQLIAEANRAANDEMFSFYQTSVAGMGPAQAMETIVRLYLQQAQGEYPPNLCPMANLGSELRHSNDSIRAVAMEGYQRMVDTFAQLTAELGIASSVGVADAIVSTIVGAVTLSQLSADLEIGASILENAQSTVHTLLLSAPKIGELNELAA